MYQKLKLIQGSPEWIAARYEYVTASQVPVLEDLSPYQTRLQLFEEKVMRVNVSDASKKNLFEFAHSMEAKSRDLINSERKLNFEPAVITNAETPDLLASLDGLDEKNGTIFEAKYVGAETIKNVLKGDFPAHHMSQIQAQLLVSGYDTAIYAVTDGKEFFFKEIKSDKKYQKQIQAEVIEFMECVRKGEPPEPSERDYFEPKDERFEKLYMLKKLMDESTDSFEALKKELVEAYQNYSRLKYKDLTMVKSVRKGAVNYSKIPMLQDVDLEQFRGKSVSSVSVKFLKGGKNG